MLRSLCQNPPHEKIKAAITAVGHFVPDKVLTNKYFEQIVDTTDEWITTRTGIKERRALEKDQPTSYMAVKSIENLLANRKISADEIEVIIVATVTPDMLFPLPPALFRKRLGPPEHGDSTSSPLVQVLFSHSLQVYNL